MPAVTPIEITTVGAKVLYAVETTAGTRPTTGYTELPGVSAAPAFDMTPETIDVSDLSDYFTQYVPGRQDPGGDAQFTLNHSEAAIDAWETMVAAANTGLASGCRLWFEYKYADPSATRSYYFCARPVALGNGGMEQNVADTIPAHVIPNGEFGWYTASTQSNPSALSLNKSSTSIAVGSNETLTATKDTAITGTSTVTWSSSDESIATVNSSGKIVAVAVGVAVVAATCGDYGAECAVTVTAGE